ncbi:MAG: 2-oxoglutarate dehydrogenase complex dihydrolipoyllysine-residue succinyltransferase [Candidatus Latescibacteria bacterium]|jgi:2-oxoglutarate dehydrogenase E2 component (dihydrolipoamide succinyltransferase)|nr:2-oxoglutarate dehydrogenase complex dihydrolipoyllysine-residue succinyltransferase [Candidatus Latescibacterota bacterium]
MPVDVVIPELGESVTEAILVEWLKADGEAVEVDEPIALLETDKADVELPAPEAGVLSHSSSGGDTILVGGSIGQIDPDGSPSAGGADDKSTPETEAPAPESVVAETESVDELSPAVRRLVTENNLDVSKIQGSGRDGRLTKEDVLKHLDAHKKPAEAKAPPAPTPEPAPVPKPAFKPQATGDGVRREPMSKIRQRIAQHLVTAQQNAAMLTTFNEVDMSGIFDIRTKYKERFQEVHGVSLGLMSFFVRASVLALQEFETINASIDGTDILYHDFVHMGIAVGTPRGVVVPVLKHTEQMSFDQIEFEIKRVATSARDGKLGLNDLSGGTFTITNGGVFGSMLSTPILNQPQTGILGMHNIQQRPVAVNGEVVIRPMMYLALTYDHRLIDGENSVKFLVRLKQLLEDPARMMLAV